MVRDRHGVHRMDTGQKTKTTPTIFDIVRIWILSGSSRLLRSPRVVAVAMATAEIPPLERDFRRDGHAAPAPSQLKLSTERRHGVSLCSSQGMSAERFGGESVAAVGADASGEFHQL